MIRSSRENLEEANVAEYGIVMKIEGPAIEGNCQLEDYNKAILIDSVAFGSSAIRTQVGTGTAKTRTSVTQSAITLTAAAGKWTAELMESLYKSSVFEKIQIVQLAQAVDKTTTAKPTEIQKLELTGAVITGVGTHWTDYDSPRKVTLTIEFEKMLLTIDNKSADFTLMNITKGAK